MAVQKNFALGRGLDALISTEEVKTAGSSSINEIELSKISVNPNQPRREFDPVALHGVGRLYCRNWVSSNPLRCVN